MNLKYKLLLIFSFVVVISVFKQQTTFSPSEVYEIQIPQILKQKEKNNITIVTAFYNINITKYNGTNSYLKWFCYFSDFIRKNVNVVIYVDSVETMYLLKNTSSKLENTNYIIFPLNKLNVYNQFTQKEWENQHIIDHEKQYQSIESYIIWLAKTELVYREVLKNNSKYYMWMDIGIVRAPMKLNNNFPRMDLISKHCNFGKMCFSIVDNRFLLQNKTFAWLERSIHVAGNLFLGDVEAWTWFNKNYYSKLNSMHKEGLFIGKDQNVYALMIKEYPDKFSLLCSGVYKEWFYLLNLFNGLSFLKSCEKTYKLNLVQLCREMQYCN